jgi:hypothetical protein
MEHEDERFERYLSEFRPREPGALRAGGANRLSQLGPWIAAAAMLVLIAGATLIWMRGQMRTGVAKRRSGAPRSEAVPSRTAPPQTETRDIGSEVSIGRLEMLYNQDPAQLDVALSEASRNLLPHVERAESTLHSLDHE